MTRRANKASKKARKRAAKYGPKKLLLAKTTPEKQDTFKKDPTDSMQLPAFPSIATKVDKQTCQANKYTEQQSSENPFLRTSKEKDN